MVISEMSGVIIAWEGFRQVLVALKMYNYEQES